MSYRQSNSSTKDNYSLPQSRLSQQIRCDSTDEGCPVIEESGTVCGETNSLSIFQEFRQMYDDCLKKLEGSVNGNATLKKLAPFKKLIDDLWEQNTMLVETVEELEQEATYRVTNLQDRLNKSCQKICDYKDDIKCLVRIIQSFCENGVFDPIGLKFKTFCCTSVFGECGNSCSSSSKREDRSSDTSFRRATSGSLKNPCHISYAPEQDKRGRKSDLYVNNSYRTFSSKGMLPTKVKCVNSSKHSSLKCEPVSFNESLCKNNYSSKSINESCKFEDDLVEDLNSPDCLPPININFNIGNDGNVDNTNCYCGCSCMLDSIEMNNC